MSANFVSKTHIDALVSAAIKWGGLPGTPFHYFWNFAEPDTDGWTRSDREVTPETAGRIGEILWRTNWENTMAGWADQRGCPYPTLPEYRFQMLSGRPSPLLILGLIADYGYQTAGDTATYIRSEASSFCEFLSSAAIGRLPGFRDLPWAIEDDDRDLFDRYPENSTTN